MLRLRTFPATALVVALVFAAPVAQEQKKDDAAVPKEFKALKYRLIGPAAGGRVSRVAACPAIRHLLRGDRLRRRLEVDRRRHDLEAGLRRPADLVDRLDRGRAVATRTSSTSAPARPTSAATSPPATASTSRPTRGKTWKHVWKQDGQIGTMVVHPKNPDVAFAAVLGHAFGPNPERGVYRTARRRQDLAAGPEEGRRHRRLRRRASTRRTRSIVFAGFWQARRRPWEMTSGGPGSGLYVSRDGGDTWKQLTRASGPARGHLGQGRRRDRAVRQPPRLRADRGGEGRPVPLRRRRRELDAGQRDTARCASAPGTTRRSPSIPANPDVVWFPQVPLLKTHRRRQDVQAASRASHHGDHHDLWIDPKNPKRMIDANDGGVDISRNGGKTWYAPPLPICAVLPRRRSTTGTPYRVAGAMQDLGTAQAPSNTPARGGITLGDWHDVGGGEAGPRRLRPERPEHRLRRRVRRHHHALRPPHRPGAQRQRLARQPVRASAART